MVLVFFPSLIITFFLGFTKIFKTHLRFSLIFSCQVFIGLYQHMNMSSDDSDARYTSPFDPIRQRCRRSVAIKYKIYL